MKLRSLIFICSSENLLLHLEFHHKPGNFHTFFFTLIPPKCFQTAQKSWSILAFFSKSFIFTDMDLGKSTGKEYD